MEIFKLLARYQYLRSSYIHAFIGGNKTKLIERLGRLYHDGRYIDRPAQQWQFSNCRHTHVIYELDAAGEAVLRERSNDSVTRLRQGGNRQRQLKHTLMVCELLAAVELGAQATPSLRFVSSHEILQHPRCSAEARSSAHPFALPAADHGSVSQPLGLTRATIVPDALFGLEYSDEDSKRYRFFALEADRDTMPLTRSTRQQSSYLGKILGYRAIIDRQTYRTHLGLPNLFVLNVTTSHAHLKNMIDTARNNIGNNRHFLFKSVPGSEHSGPVRTTILQLFSSPWARVGFEPFCFAQC
jgi:hypothetical protein